MRKLSKKDRETLTEILKWARDEEIDVLDDVDWTGTGMAEWEIAEEEKKNENMKKHIDIKYARLIKMVDMMHIEAPKKSKG